MQSAQDFTAAPTHVLVVGGRAIVERLERLFLRDLSKYNKRLELLRSPVVVCDKHQSNGKEYRGRYFKERYWCEKDEVIKWRHLGTHVPEDFVPNGGFPPCPENPLEGWDGQVIDNSVVMRPEIYERLIEHFMGSFVVPINWSDNVDGIGAADHTTEPYCVYG